MDDFMVHNWRRWQPKKPDSPEWIRLHLRLLDDFDFACLPDAAKAHAVLIWLLAARNGNRLRRDPRFIGRLIGAVEPVDLDALEEAGFIEPWQDTADDASDEAGSRYIPPDVRKAVSKRDGGVCVVCGSSKRVEFSLVVPASKGGFGNDKDNVRMVCRGCSRPARAKATPQATPQATLERSHSYDTPTNERSPSYDSAQPSYAGATYERREERREEETREDHTTRAREVAPLPGPAGPEPAEPAPTKKPQMTTDSVEQAEHEITNLPVDAIAPLQALLDARARCLVAASHRGGMPPFMPGSPASVLPWTSQWPIEGRAIAGMVSDFGLDDFAAGCEAMVKSQFNIAANPATFIKTCRTKCEQARDSAAARAELGPPEGDRGEQTYGDPSRHVNLSIVRDEDG